MGEKKQENNKILKKYLILCEGVDTFKFIITFLESDALNYDNRFANDIQALYFEGINNLRNFISIIKNMENYDNVNRILILRDAETDVKSAIQMVQSDLTKARLPVPPNCNTWVKNNDNLGIAFTLMPTCSPKPTPGALEDLCWEILDDTYGMKADIKKFVEHISQTFDSIGAHEHKSRLHSFLSVNDKYISLKIGEAAKTGAFNWNSQYLAPLKEIIEKGFD